MNHGLMLAFLIAVCGASLALPQSTVTKTPAAKKTAASKSAASRNSTAKTAPKTTASKTAGARKGKSSKSAKRSPADARQIQPTPERYREIQQALVDKGYLKSEPTGVWDADSSAALAQFQNDRKLPPTGKLTSASLIGLGLGPGTAPVPTDSPHDSAAHNPGTN